MGVEQELLDARLRDELALEYVGDEAVYEIVGELGAVLGVVFARVRHVGAHKRRRVLHVRAQGGHVAALVAHGRYGRPADARHGRERRLARVLQVLDEQLDAVGDHVGEALFLAAEVDPLARQRTAAAATANLFLQLVLELLRRLETILGRAQDGANAAHFVLVELARQIEQATTATATAAAAAAARVRPCCSVRVVIVVAAAVAVAVAEA